MALILCPECGREVSDRAKACPGCGCPVELKLGYPKCAFFTNKRKAIVEMENGRMRFTLNDEVIADDYLCHYTLVFICDKYEYDFHLYADGNPKMISIYLKYSEQKYYDYLVKVFTNFCKVDMVANFADATTYLSGMTYKEYKKAQKNQRPCNMPANNNWEALSTLADANKAKKEEKARKKQERRDNIVASAILYDIMTRHK